MSVRVTLSGKRGVTGKKAWLRPACHVELSGNLLLVQFLRSKFILFCAIYVSRVLRSVSADTTPWRDTQNPAAQVAIWIAFSMS